MTNDDTMALLARVRWLEAENQRLIEHAAQAEADRDVLSAEVEAWRHNERVVEETFPGQEQRFVARMAVRQAKEHTNSTGALQRAKEDK